MMTFFFIVNTGKSSLFSFCEIMNSGVAVLCAIFYYLLYMVTENVDLLFQVRPLSLSRKVANMLFLTIGALQVHIHGLSGYLAGVSIAVKQVMPDHVLAR